MSKENTARILKGQDPIQSFRCRTLKWHRWTAWSIIEEDWNQGRMGHRLRCHCADCGLVRYETPYSETLSKKHE